MKRTGAWVAGAPSRWPCCSRLPRRSHEDCLRGESGQADPEDCGQADPECEGVRRQKYNPEINNFFTQRVTINAGDTVSFRTEGFHTIDLPGAAKSDLPLIMPSGTTSGVNDAAGSPFWFNGLPSVGINPALFARQGPGTYNGTTRDRLGAPARNGAPKPMNIKFSKPGVYKYFCDVHPGMVGTSIVKPKGAKIPSAKRAEGLAKQITSDVKMAKKLAKKKPAEGHGRSRRGGQWRRRVLHDVPGHAEGEGEHDVSRSRWAEGTREMHTATFGPASVLKTLSDAFQGANFPSQGVYPSDPAAIVV